MTKNIIPLPSARRSLHKWLWAVSDPYIGTDKQPIIIGRYQASYSGDRDNRYGRFRLQYGGRSWTYQANSLASYGNRHAPAYEVMMEKLANVLAEIEWDELATCLLPKSAENFAADSQKKPVEMFLLIEGRESYFSVRDINTQEAKSFDVTANGLSETQMHPKAWFNAWPRQIQPPVLPPQTIAELSQDDSPHSLTKRVQWWYNTPLLNEEEAKRCLGNMLRVYFRRLAEIGSSVAIATSPHRFDDATGEDNWLAAFVDGEIWEQGHYFAPADNQLALAPPKLHEAIGLLNDVTKSSLRHSFAEYFGTAAIAPDCMFLSADKRGDLIAFSVSNGDGGPVYLANKETGLPRLVGVAPRLDWNFSEYKGLMQDGEYITQPKDYVVEFIPINEWIAERTSNKSLPYDYPNLNHV